ncbi:ankyrin repeat-containing domain protein [Zopfochytrium polystomum]|nr:ankyrin repeat-containing domain protein [Zopfochytrium polystomum]
MDDNTAAANNAAALVNACLQGQLLVVEQLLAAGADTNASANNINITYDDDNNNNNNNNNNSTEQHTLAASASGSLPLPLPLPNGVHHQCTPLYAACAGGHAEIAALLIEHGANPNDLAGVPPRKRSPLIAAIHANIPDCVRLLLARGRADPNGSSDPACAGDGLRIPLIATVIRGGRRDIVASLLDAGANVNVADDGMGVTALHVASGYPSSLDRDVVRLLLERGANPNAVTRGISGSVLMGAAHVGDPFIVAALLDAGADVNAHAENGETALYQAVGANRTDVVPLLLGRGADPNAPKRTAEGVGGVTPIFLAAGRGYATIIKQLTAAGADPNALSEAGVPPLAPAVLGDRIDSVRALLEAGADPDAADALIIAIELDRVEMVRLFLEKCDVNRVHLELGETPLIFATVAGKVDMVRLLLTRADVDLNFRRTSDGATALTVAMQSGFTEIISLLEAAGALR